MHPMEWSLLADPAKWLASVPIYDPVVRCRDQQRDSARGSSTQS